MRFDCLVNTLVYCLINNETAQQLLFNYLKGRMAMVKEVNQDIVKIQRSTIDFFDLIGLIGGVHDFLRVFLGAVAFNFSKLRL